jgi:hypothetical protein
MVRITVHDAVRRCAGSRPIGALAGGRGYRSGNRLGRVVSIRSVGVSDRIVARADERRSSAAGSIAHDPVVDDAGQQGGRAHRGRSGEWERVHRATRTDRLPDLIGGRLRRRRRAKPSIEQKTSQGSPSCARMEPSEPMRGCVHPPDETSDECSVLGVFFSNYNDVPGTAGGVDCRENDSCPGQ